MKLFRKEIKLKILSALLIPTLLLFLSTPIFSWYVFRSQIPYMSISTGRLDLDIQPKHLFFNTDQTQSNIQEVTFSNGGTLGIRYETTAIHKSNDCQFVNGIVTRNNGYSFLSSLLNAQDLIPPSSLDSNHTLSYSFSLKETAPLRNINCEINIHIIAWQDIFPEPTLGFTDKEILKFNILFKREFLEILEMSEVKSFTTSDLDILPEPYL